jgi:hypothetical protein
VFILIKLRYISHLLIDIIFIWAHRQPYRRDLKIRYDGLLVVWAKLRKSVGFLNFESRRYCPVEPNSLGLVAGSTDQ